MGDDVRVRMSLWTWGAALRGYALSGDPAARVLGRPHGADPYPRYERVRAGGRLVRSRLGLWVTADHELVNTVLRDPRFGVRTANDRGRDEFQPAALETAHTHPIEDSFLSLDPPAHTRLRRLVAPWFGPRALRDRADSVERVVSGFLDELADRGSFDLIDDFAARVPIRIICDLLGVPSDEYDRFVRWGGILATSLDSTRTHAEHRALVTALAEMDAFFTDRIERRRRDPVPPGTDIVGDLVATESGPDPLSRRDLLATVELLLVAGFETTVNLIGNGTLALLANPAARAWLAADPDRAPDVVEEVLRHDPPVQHTLRLAHEPVTLAGQRISRDTGVLLLLAGAGRDPALFDRPDEFDPARPNNREHVAFSAGIHYCLGAGLARLEAAVALRALFERFPGLRAAGRARRRPSRNIHGVAHLPVAGAAVRGTVVA